MLLHFDPPFSGLWKICRVSTLYFSKNEENVVFWPIYFSKNEEKSYFDPYFSSKLGKMYSFDPPFLTLVAFRVDGRWGASLSETWLSTPPPPPPPPPGAKPISTARGLSATQPEACMRSLTTQKPKRLPRVRMQTCCLATITYRRVSYDRSCPVADHSLYGASPKPHGWRHAMFLFYF